MSSKSAGELGDRESPRAVVVRPRLLQAFAVFGGMILLIQLGGWFGRICQTDVSPIMPSLGLGVAAVVILGVGYAFPAIAFGAFIGTLLLTGSTLGAALDALAQSGGAVLAARLFLRTGDPSLSRLRDFFHFALTGVLGGAGFCTLLLFVASPLESESLSMIHAVETWLALSLGVLIFGTFSLFVFRRQDLRPPKLRGAYEMLLYSTLLAWLVYLLLTDPSLDEHGLLFLLAGCFLLGLLVAIRFGLRPLSLFIVIFVFFLPTFLVVYPDRASLAAVIRHSEAFVTTPGLPAFLGVLGCLLVAAFRDELVALQMKLDLAMASAEMCVWEWSPLGWNFHTQGWCESFGLKPEHTVSDSTLMGSIYPDDRKGFETRMDDLRTGACGPLEYTYRFRDGGGDWRWVQSRAQMLRKTADDDVSVAAGITRDVTQERIAIQARIAAIENEAELKMLRSQLNPHFLFNSLNSVRVLIGRDDPQARTMITALANLLRDVLSMRGDMTHELSREVTIVETYLSIEGIRYGERLAYEIDVDPAASHRKVPGMMIQTLVENSVKHGISQREQGGRIFVRVRIDPVDASLHISVLNDGSLGGPSGGFGIENTRRRISLATSGQGTLSLIELPGPRVEATVVLPADPQTAPPRTHSVT